MLDQCCVRIRVNKMQIYLFSYNFFHIAWPLLSIAVCARRNVYLPFPSAWPTGTAVALEANRAKRRMLMYCLVNDSHLNWNRMLAGDDRLTFIVALSIQSIDGEGQNDMRQGYFARYGLFLYTIV